MTRIASGKKRNAAKVLQIACAVICAVVTIGCANSTTKGDDSHAVLSTKAITDLPLPVAPDMTHADSLEFKYLFIDAVRRQVAEDYDGAFYLLKRCLEINPAAPEVRYKLAMYWSAIDQDSLAMRDFELAAALDPTNSDYLERLAQYSIAMSNYDKAIRVYEYLANVDKDREDVLTVLMQLYKMNNNYEKMIEVINRIEMIEGSNEDLTFSKMRVYEMMDNKEAAWKALKDLSDQHPYDLSYKVMLGNWLMNNGKMDEAYDILSKSLDEDPSNVEVLTSMYDYYRKVGEDSIAGNLMMDIVMNPKTDTETKASFIRKAIQINEANECDSTEIIDLFDKVIAVNPHDIELLEMKAGYMMLKLMPEEQINSVYEQILDFAPDNSTALIQLLLSYIDSKDWKKMVEVCKAGTEYNPDDMIFYYYLGMAHYQQDEYQQALEAFRNGIAQVHDDSNKGIVSDFYYFMGDIEYKVGNEKAAFEAYDSCLRWKPDNVPCLNNYAYYLSLKNEQLDKAERMSFKTIKAEPDNVTYLDTYAWILFQQKRYAEALIYVEQIMTEDIDSVQSGVVIEHAGDIYYMNDKTDKALECWRKALEIDPENAILRRKVKLKKYVE